MPNLRSSPAADISREFQTGLPPDVRTRPYIEYVSVDVSSTSEILSGEEETIELYAPNGYVYRCKAMFLYAPSPSGASSGHHIITVNIVGPIDILYMDSNYNDPITYTRCEVYIASKEHHPTDNTVLGLIPNYLFADENNSLRVKYINSTDVSQTNTRVVRFLIEKVRV